MDAGEFVSQWQFDRIGIDVDALIDLLGSGLSYEDALAEMSLDPIGTILEMEAARGEAMTAGGWENMTLRPTNEDTEYSDDVCQFQDQEAILNPGDYELFVGSYLTYPGDWRFFVDAPLACTQIPVTHGEIEKSSIVRLNYPILHDAVKNIGSVQIRNVATIGGNLVNAVPSADGAIPLIALDGKAHIYGTKGRRSVDLRRFFLGPGQCDLDRGEILLEIAIPPLLPRTGGAYVKHGRREAMELPMLGVGTLLSLEEDIATCARARICLGVAAPTPLRCREAEKYLVGKTVDETSLAEAGRIAAEESRVRDSIRGLAWYRREMVAVLVKRMGLKALERARQK